MNFLSHPPATLMQVLEKEGCSRMAKQYLENDSAVLFAEIMAELEKVNDAGKQLLLSLDRCGDTWRDCVREAQTICAILEDARRFVAASEVCEYDNKCTTN